MLVLLVVDRQGSTALQQRCAAQTWQILFLACRLSSCRSCRSVLVALAQLEVADNSSSTHTTTTQLQLDSQVKDAVTTTTDIVLKLVTSNQPPPVNIRVVIGKGAATSATYRPQPSTSPLYDFCELQTLMLRNLDRVQLKDVDLRCPDGPLAKRLRQRFYEMLHCNVKLGKRMLSEFRADESTSTYYLHVLVSSDGQRLTLRAKLLYDPVYLRVPVVEDGKVCPWNKPAFAEICEAIQHASV